MRSDVIALVLLVVPRMVIAQTGGPTSVGERYLLAAANAERVGRGLPALRWDDALNRAADGHAREMAARRSISHQYPGEAELSARGRAAGARFSRIAENVAESPDTVTMHDAWMHSPGHRANLLDSQVDRVGIRVISRGGELYAVEDFERSVPSLSLEQQESAVEELIQRQSTMKVFRAPSDSRRTCAMETGYSGARQPAFVMRYTSADLSKLPELLQVKVESGRYSQAAIGACTVGGGQNFTTYSIAVLLFP
jgi:hypothetical protein